MTKIALADEMIANHTTEEVVAWCAKTLQEVQRVVSQDSYSEYSQALSMNVANIWMVLTVLQKLDAKLNKSNGSDEPIVL